MQSLLPVPVQLRQADEFLLAGGQREIRGGLDGGVPEGIGLPEARWLEFCLLFVQMSFWLLSFFP